MRKLMSANLARLRRDRILGLALLSMLVCSVVNMLNGCRQATQDMSEFSYRLEHYYFAGMPMMGLFIAVFVSLFVGTEYGDGTMRNKLIVGHTRGSVYLANLITGSIASLAMLLVWFVGGLVGVPTLGMWQMGEGGMVVAVYLLTAVLMTCALCAIFILAAMLTTNRAMSAVVCILLWIALLFVGSYFYNALCEPEMYEGIVITAEGMQLGEPTPNPRYISGAKRLMYEFVSDFFPTSQGIALQDLAAERPVRMMLCSAVIFFNCTALGMALFTRKDLK